MKQHQPVLAAKIIEILNPKKGESFVDFTAGYGGHSSMLLSRVGKSGFGYLFDQDPEAVEFLQCRFAENSNVSIDQVNFASIDWENDLPSVDIMLADLGVSSPQLEDINRGFSFRTDARLDMRMDPNTNITAEMLVNQLTEKELADLIYSYAEERASRRIAKAIVQARRKSKITSTKQLVDIISNVVSKRSKINPATKTFQALRIAVNDELSALASFLENFDKKLNLGGRIAIISFHSLEDRMVKQKFKQLCRPTVNERGQIIKVANYKMVTKKPIKGSEFDINPRARSAKLRVVEKIN